MSFQFKLIAKQDINCIIPLMQKLTNNANSDAVLKERFAEMVTQNYECAGVYEGDTLIGMSGMWFQTRHYVGRSMEVDHVFIEEKSSRLFFLIFPLSVANTIFKFFNSYSC